LATLHISEQSSLRFRFTSRSIAPIECPLLNYIDVTGEQQYYENQHLEINQTPKSKGWAGQRSEDNCPGHQEDDFNIEQDKYHGDKVEFHGKALTGTPNWVLATLVRHQLRPGPLSLSNELRNKNVDHGKSAGDNEHQQHRQVVVKTKWHLRNQSGSVANQINARL
jgi:hypothetical protein